MWMPVAGGGGVALDVPARMALRSELALRAALALLPCAVLALHFPALLGRSWSSPLVPLAIAFANAFMAVSLARQVLRRGAFLAFWGLYATVWTAAAWHGLHFHRPPRPAALLLNLAEISRAPLPHWTEMPWALVGAALVLAWLARRPSPGGGPLGLATAAAMVAFVAAHAVTFSRYRTRQMLRLSQYGDLVRTQGLEGAAALDALQLFGAPDSGGILRDLRVEAQANPAAPLLLDPVSPDRVVIVQMESVEQAALTPGGTPTLLRLWTEATHGMIDPQRSSVSGSSGADFQLLTGLRPLAGVPVYKLAWDRDPRGLPAHAASRGFSFHAFHGNDGNFWNRRPFFTSMGVDFHSIEAIAQTEYSRWGRADGDLFRYGAAQVRRSGRAVHFFITLSTHGPFDLVDPAAHLETASQTERYLLSIAYLDRALAEFLRALPGEGVTLVALYADHASGVIAPPAGDDEPAVPMILGTLTPDGTLAPLRRAGIAVHGLSGVHELSALHRYLEDCLDAAAH